MRARAPRLMHLDDAIERDVVFCGVLETPSDKLGVHTTGALAATSVAPHGKNVLLIACGDRLSPHLHTHHAAAAGDQWPPALPEKLPTASQKSARKCFLQTQNVLFFDFEGEKSDARFKFKFATTPTRTTLHSDSHNLRTAHYHDCYIAPLYAPNTRA
jgi:hypothetical protein